MRLHLHVPWKPDGRCHKLPVVYKAASGCLYSNMQHTFMSSRKHMFLGGDLEYAVLAFEKYRPGGF